MTTLQQVELGVLGPLQVRQYGLPVSIPGAKPRAILTMLGLHGGSVVSADTLVELLWGDDPPRTAAKALQTHISSLRRTLGDGFVLTEGTGWTLSTTEIDATRYKVSARMGRDAIAAGDTSQAVARFDEALTLWRGTPELPDGPRGVSEKTRWIEGHAALVEDRADALLATGRAAEIIGDLEAAVADAPLRERRWGQLMLALYRAGRQGEALGAYQRARSLLADELGVDPGPDLRRLEAAIVAQDDALEMPVSQQLTAVTRAVTFLLTDIEGSTTAWEADPGAMALALARHDEVVEQVVTSRAGRLIKTRGEGDATFSVFDRPSAAASAAIELQEAIRHEPWALSEPMRIRVALHTGEVELRDGDYFGRAVNRAARLRSLAAGGQILCSGATAELVIDSLSDDVILDDLGMRQLKNLARPEHVFELRLETADDSHAVTTDTPMERPALPAVLAGPGPFVGRGRELERLLSAWQTALDGGAHAVLIAGEPGVGKTRLAGEWCRHAYEQGAVVLYGRCDEDLGAPYQPFAEALRSLIPSLGASRLRGLRGVEALLSLVPGLTDLLPDLAAPPRADPDTERYALFDAVVAVLGVASTSAPVVLILDDLHWAAKPTLLLLRHLLRFGEHARVQIVGTYRSTDLDRSHPLAAMLADLNRDGSATRLQLSGLDQVDVSAYLAEAGYDDEELARALASVTGGNPFFLIEALRHVDESGGRWDPSTLPQGVREAVSRRLSRLPAETNKALAAAAVVGSRFALELVEQVVGDDLVDAFDEACKAGIVIEEPGGRYRFNHAIVRQSLLAELASVRRMRLHQRIAATLETEPGADDELLAELAYHYFECAWAGNAAKAVDYCRRAADQAMARLAYEGAADLYDRAVHALEEVDEELPDRDDQQAELLVARCEALLAAGDVVSAAGAVSQLQAATRDSARLAAWGTCFDGQLSMLTDPERLDAIESAVAAAAEKLAGLDDAAGEAKAHTVRAGCLARLGRIGDCETALDHALTAARSAREHRRVNAVLAGAPLAALWGPNPVPRAGGRCLDVVRLLRITTGSPVVEATSTRCQAVLDALRGRAAAGRSLLDSAKRTLTELGMRHALLEVDQFAGILELVADDPAAAEPHLRRAYNGFRRMGLDADTAETAALLARACLALDRDAEADELCTESERLAGHALKASIAWRTVRAQLMARSGVYDEARRMAEEAVAVAGRTDLLVDHGDACLALATVLKIAGDGAGARAAAEQAVGLYELKGAAALAETARRILGAELPAAPIPPQTPSVELDNACVRVGERVLAAIDREAWDEVQQLFAPEVVAESHRKIVGFSKIDLPSDEWRRRHRRVLETGDVRANQVVIAVRGDRLALARVFSGTADVSPGAPQDEFLQLYGIDEAGLIALQVWFDLDDIDAALAELDAAHARLEERHPRPPLENAASRTDAQLNALFARRSWDEIGAMFTDDMRLDDRRQGLRRESTGRAAAVAEVRAIADLGVKNIASDILAIRGERLVVSRTRFSGRDQRPEAFHTELLRIVEIDSDERIVAVVDVDLEDVDAAIAELDARYLAGEAAAHAHTWSVIAGTYAEFNRHDHDPSSVVNIDNRRVTRFAPGDLTAANTKGLTPNLRAYIESVHRLGDLGAVVTCQSSATSQEGFEAEWRTVLVQTVDGDLMDRNEMFDEADIDAAIARFDELNRPAPQLDNAAHRVLERYLAHFPVRDWDAMAELLADDFSADDRRHVVNAGVRSGRDAEIANVRVIAEVGVTYMTAVVIATRGERLVLTRGDAGNDERAEAFHNEVLAIAEIDGDERIAAMVSFDIDDLDAAFEELDARYLAGEAAAHAHTWPVIADTYAEFNRNGRVPDWVTVDHRRGSLFASSNLNATIRTSRDLTPDLSIYIETVHRLSDYAAVVTNKSFGTSREGFVAEWRMIQLLSVESDQISRLEIFDEADIDTALARFDDLDRPAPRLENAASQLLERFQTYFAARDWTAMAEILAEDLRNDDRRTVVGAGVLLGRDTDIAHMRAIADVGATNITSTVIATRGERVVLSRVLFSGEDQGPEAFQAELLGIVEIDADEQIVARLSFDADDIDAAFGELDARYLAGEAAAHSHTWSLVAGGYAGLNRRQIPATTPDWVNIDHRRGAVAAPGDIIAHVRAMWDLTPNISYRIEAVHRLTNLGAVVSRTTYGTSADGFDAEWRAIDVQTVQGDLINRSEIFGEADLDAALARFEELCPTTPRLENAASRAHERFWRYFPARDWDALAEILADDFSSDDRRRVVGAGVRHGRTAEIENLRAIANVLIKDVTSTVMAIRGERLILSSVRFATGDQGTEAFFTEVLSIAEIDADDRIVAVVAFDPDDIDAAFAELDARYLAGEAAAHSRTWSVMASAFAALNRHELPETTADYVIVDHRLQHTTIGASGLTENLRASWDLTPDLRMYIETVHRLTDLGAVVTQASHGTSQEGFDAEWRDIGILTVDGDLISRCEKFDEADVDAALARFDELSRPAPRLENAASRVLARFWTIFEARDWAAVAETMADGFTSYDHRRVVNAGVRRGRDVHVTNMRAVAEVGFENLGSTVIATRGQRLALSRTRSAVRGLAPEEVDTESIMIVEIDADNRLAASALFDVDDIDAAFAELDARYAAGEAAAHAETWSVIAGVYAAFNRHEFPATTRDWVSVDHRRLITIEAGDMAASIGAVLDQLPSLSIYIEAVHQLTDVGAVVAHVAHGVSQEGFDAEWRMIFIYAADGDLINRFELFDEADLDAALARFEELRPPAPRLENAASQVVVRYQACFSGRDWDTMAELLAADVVSDDRRRVVNAGVREGRATHIADLRAAAEVGAESFSSSVIATRGQRLALARVTTRNRGFDENGVEIMGLCEIDPERRIAAVVTFDSDDIEPAFEELDARYVRGEGAAHAHSWSVIAEMYGALNRHELPAMTPDIVNVDHRPLVTIEPSDLAATLRAAWNLVPDLCMYVEAVHRLSSFGAVVTNRSYGTSREGFDAEWRMVQLLTVERDAVNRFEIFDEADIDAALTRFDELGRSTPQLENAASQVGKRYLAQFAAGDWDAMAETLADDVSADDRRRVVGAGVRRGRDAEIADMRAIADLGLTDARRTAVLATRGERLILGRVRFSGREHGPEAIVTDVLGIVETNADNRIAATVVFDPENLEAAFAELDARYLAGEAAAHAHTWSVIAEIYAGLNRHEVPATTPDWVDIDHRHVTTIAPGALIANLRAFWDLTPQASIYLETVHRLTDLGAVVTHSLSGTSQEGFQAEWRMVDLVTFEGDLMNRSELFDEADLDAALARFDELDRPAPQPENAATRAWARLADAFNSRDIDSAVSLIAADKRCDDRRKGLRNEGPAREVARVVFEAPKSWRLEIEPVAIRGSRLGLTRHMYRDTDCADRPITVEFLTVTKVSDDDLIHDTVIFDPDDIDAAFAELDARYLAGEAAAHPHTWSLVKEACAAFNRRELPPTTPDWANIDHRRGAGFAPDDVIPYLRAAWEVTPDVNIYIEAVHRLSNLGAVVTHVSKGSSQQGFDAEWRVFNLMTVEGDLFNRCEIFDESELEAALARFDELSQPVPYLENTATRVLARAMDAFNCRDLDSFLAVVTADGRYEDRRKGLRDEGQIKPGFARTLFSEAPTSWQEEIEPVAIRGPRLVLCRVMFRDHSEVDRPIAAEALVLTEVTDDDLIHDTVIFDLDDIDAAFAELDARYLAGEAAAHAQTWSVVVGAYAAFNRRELPATTTDWVNIDHRRGIAFAPGDLIPYVRAAWDVAPDVHVYIEAVHRLSRLGAVVTYAANGTSRERFAADWSQIALFTVEGELINRFEMFDDGDIDASLARFDELGRQVPQLENTATRTWAGLTDAFNRRDVDGFLRFASADGHYEDRRKGLRDSVDGPAMQNLVHAMFETAPNSWHMAVEPIAIRESRLSLTRECYRDTDDADRPIVVEVLRVTEVSDGGLVHDIVTFDPDDVDAAFEELEAHYQAGEAAAHAHAWSVVVGAYAALNRRELPATTQDMVNADHRPLATIGEADLAASMRAVWDVTPELSIHIEAVHRSSHLGAVVTHAAHGITRDGFDAAWRMVAICTVDGGLISRWETFDATDVDAALARFDELDRPAPLLENAATRVYARMMDAHNRRELDSFLAVVTADGRYEDRRKGLRDKGPIKPDFARALFTEAAPSWQEETEPVAIRGPRLVLCRLMFRDHSAVDRPIAVEALVLTEVTDDELTSRLVIFDPDDINAAMAELTSRWIASGEVAHPQVVETVCRLTETVNRHDWDAFATLSAGATYVNHRQLSSPGVQTITDHMSSIRTMASLVPDYWVELAEVLTLSAMGLVSDVFLRGTSTDGLSIEIPLVMLIVVDRDRVIGFEAFDPDQRELALARFEELNRPT